jgi:hypothetical protein
MSDLDSIELVARRYAAKLKADERYDAQQHAKLFEGFADEIARLGREQNLVWAPPYGKAQ